MAPRLWHRLSCVTWTLVLVSLSACASGAWNFGSWNAEYADESGPVAGSPNVGNYVTTAAVAFRDGPSSAIRLLAVLPRGTSVATDGRALNGWWGINYQATQGWIYGSYLKPQ